VGINLELKVTPYKLRRNLRARIRSETYRPGDDMHLPGLELDAGSMILTSQLRSELAFYLIKYAIEDAERDLSSPEDPRVIRIDFSDHLVHVPGSYEIEDAPALVTVREIKRPNTVFNVVAELSDGVARPLRTKIWAPRRATFDDGERSTPHGYLDLQAITKLSRDAFCAVLTDPGDIEVENLSHRATLEEGSSFAKCKSASRIVIEYAANVQKNVITSYSSLRLFPGSPYVRPALW
jgi:hypothetical protein